jgi:hypothetical protein
MVHELTLKIKPDVRSALIVIDVQTVSFPGVGSPSNTARKSFRNQSIGAGIRQHHSD